MNPTDLPQWLGMIRAAGLGLGPLLTFAAALIAAKIAHRAYRQRKEADERAEWWRRVQWALEYASDPDAEKVRIGLRALNHLVDSSLANDDDKDMVRDVLDEVIDVAAERDYNGATRPGVDRPRSRWQFRRRREEE